MKLYLDYNASGPMRPEVLALMREVLALTGNASSVHGFGRAARTLVEKAREQVAALAGTHANQVIFTASATEANNMVLRAFHGSRILVSSIEHPSVLEAAPEAQLIAVTRDGLVDEDAFTALLDKGSEPALVFHHDPPTTKPASSRTSGGWRKSPRKNFPPCRCILTPCRRLVRIALDFPAWHIDYMSLSAHKLGGPQGAGALITAPGAKPVKLLHGGGQEKRQRAGTENVAAIAEFPASPPNWPRKISRHFRTSRRCATGWKRNCAAPPLPSSFTGKAHRASPILHCSACPASPLRRRSWRSTSRASRCPAARPVPVARSRPATSCARWASPKTSRKAPCASRWDPLQRRPKSTISSASGPTWPRRIVRKGEEAHA